MMMEGEFKRKKKNLPGISRTDSSVMMAVVKSADFPGKTTTTTTNLNESTNDRPHVNFSVCLYFTV